MIDEKELENDTETEVDEEAESMSVLKDMISTLNELPTDVLRQLAENLDEVEEYNKAHPLDDGDED